MRVLSRLIFALVCLAVIVTSIGWYVSTQPDSWERFDSCHVVQAPEGGGRQLVLSFTYGALQEVSPTVDTTGSGYVVSLKVRQGGGDVPAIALHGEVTFSAPSEDAAIRYPDGKELDCPSA